MRYIKFYESFNYIKSICDKFNITNYTINDDESIDVNGNVDLRGKVFFDIFTSSSILSKKHKPNHNYSLEKFPLKFRNVTGNFDCRCNNLTSLEGGPVKVGGDYFIYMNNLTSLIGCPKEVGRFLASENSLKSLEGAPEIVRGDFNISDNNLTTLIGGPKKVDGYYSFEDNNIIDLEGFPKNHFNNVFFGKTNIQEIINIFFTEKRDYVGEIGYLIDEINDLDVIQGNYLIKDRMEELYYRLGEPYLPSNFRFPILLDEWQSKLKNYIII